MGMVDIGDVAARLAAQGQEAGQGDPGRPEQDDPVVARAAAVRPSGFDTRATSPWSELVCGPIVHLRGDEDVTRFG